MDLSSLKGQEIKIKKMVYSGSNGARIKTVTYTVLETYPHHILCGRIAPETGAQIRESFNISDLMRSGIIRGGRATEWIQ